MMAIPFLQTTRTIQDDRFFVSLMLVPVTCLLLAGWSIWLLQGEVTLYEASQSAYLRNARTVIAEFPPSALGTLNKSQAASVILDGFPRTEYGTLPASITLIRHKPGAGAVEVRLSITGDAASTIPLQKGQTGVVEVATEQISPTLLFLRTLLTAERSEPAS